MAIANLEDPAPSERPRILLGSCSWTAPGWKRAFYPPGLPQAEYLDYYSSRFDTVEIDSTFYGIPAPTTVAAWAAHTPPGFIFTAKTPRTITHERVLIDADEEIGLFVRTLEPLGPRLGPLLLQFPHFNRAQFNTLDAFLQRLGPFMDRLPRGFKWAIEVRNSGWVRPQLLDALVSRGASLALIDYPRMPRPAAYASLIKTNPPAFLYVRWLGDRKGIELQTTTWDKSIVDRTGELAEWAELLRETKVFTVYSYANNHYAGYSPSTLHDFDRIWGGGLLKLTPQRKAPVQPSLFDDL